MLHLHGILNEKCGECCNSIANLVSQLIVKPECLGSNKSAGFFFLTT